MTLNQFEFGQTVRANIGKDVSTNTGLRVLLQPKNGTPVNATDSDLYDNVIIGVATLGTVDVAEGDETYLANQYVEYVVKENDLSVSGLWRIKGEADTATTKVSGDYKRFTVLD